MYRARPKSFNKWLYLLRCFYWSFFEISMAISNQTQTWCFSSFSHFQVIGWKSIEQVKTFYSENGSKFPKLRSFLHTHGVTHLTTPPYTREHNGLSKCKHHHLVERAHCLLHHVSLLIKFWSHALQTAAYLIKRMPILALNNEVTFRSPI